MACFFGLFSRQYSEETESQSQGSAGDGKDEHIQNVVPDIHFIRVWNDLLHQHGQDGSQCQQDGPLHPASQRQEDPQHYTQHDIEEGKNTTL